jgi:hypothetical protein
MWYLYTMEFYAAMKNEMLSFTGKWMELENMIKVRAHKEGVRIGKT